MRGQTEIPVVEDRIGQGRRGTWALSAGQTSCERTANDRGYFPHARFRIGLFVPMCGAAGIWGPSCIASAQVAIKEINDSGGILGQEAELVLVDAALEAAMPVEVVAHALIEQNAIAAVVGMHISAVRQKLAKIIGGRVPYVYTPLYEGNERTPGIFALGETPQEQLRPAIRRVAEIHRVKKWALIGNDYVWPRFSHTFAKQYIAASDGELVHESYVPFGFSAVDELVEAVALSGADAVLVSLVGQDAVEFNRAFGARNLDRSIVRLSAAVEENGLLAAGAENTKRLYSVAGYFSALNTPENQAFRESYYNFHGDRAPALNTLGQSIYEGTHFLSALGHSDGLGAASLNGKLRRPLQYRSARGSVYYGNDCKTMPMYLARADGYVFSILERLT